MGFRERWHHLRARSHLTNVGGITEGWADNLPIRGSARRLRRAPEADAGLPVRGRMPRLNGTFASSLQIRLGLSEKPLGPFCPRSFSAAF